MTSSPGCIVHPEVADALNANRAVVALETAVLTHGLPRTPLATIGVESLPPAPAPGWNAAAPLHLEVASAVARAVRVAGAVPATIGVAGGKLHIGMDDADLHALGSDPAPAKAAADNLASVVAGGGFAGTTVSATLIACHLAGLRSIRVLATGGIGGVHRGWTDHADISADLTTLGRVATCVVCAGAKSILDLPATLEALQTLGVPVVGFETDHLPRFQARATSDLPLRQRVDDASAAAALCRVHWDALRRDTGIVLVANVPEAFAVSASVLDRETAAAEEGAEVSGPDRTPYLLDELAQRTAGATVRANIALLLNNATIAARVAAALDAGVPEKTP